MSPPASMLSKAPAEGLSTCLDRRACRRQARSDRLQDTLGELGSVIHAVLPHGPGLDLAGEESPGQVWGDRGREYLSPLRGGRMWQSGKSGLGRSRGCSSRGTTRTGMCDRADAPALPMLARADSRRVYAAVKSKACNYPLGADPADVSSYGSLLFSYQALGAGPQQRCSVWWFE